MKVNSGLRLLLLAPIVLAATAAHALDFQITSGNFSPNAPGTGARTYYWSGYANFFGDEFAVMWGADSAYMQPFGMPFSGPSIGVTYTSAFQTFLSTMTAGQSYSGAILQYTINSATPVGLYNINGLANETPIAYIRTNYAPPVGTYRIGYSINVQSAVPGPGAAIPFALMALRRRRRKA